MDTKFVISQLVNAVIVIVTTVIVTRLTLKGSLGISENTKTRIKTTGMIYGVILLMLLHFGHSVWRTYNFINEPEPPTRLEIVIVSGYTWTISVYFWLIGAGVTYLVFKKFRRKRE